MGIQRLVGRSVLSFAVDHVECGSKETATVGIDFESFNPAPLRELIGIEIEKNKFVDIDSARVRLSPDVLAIVDQRFGHIIAADAAKPCEVAFIWPEHHAQGLLCHGIILSLVSRTSNVADAGALSKGSGRGFPDDRDGAA